MEMMMTIIIIIIIIIIINYIDLNKNEEKMFGRKCVIGI
jgi:hypothetical protein